LIDIIAGNGDVASEVKRFPTGGGEIEIHPPSDPLGPAGAATDLPGMKIHIQRMDHIRALDSLTVIKPTSNTQASDAAGNSQLVELKVSMGNWSGLIYVPFAEEAGDRLQPDQWHGGFVLPPGAIAPLQVQLGFSRHPLPARVTLDQFKLIPENGAGTDDPKATMKDIVSTVTLSGSEKDGGSYSAVAKLNQPIYFGNGNWFFSQAAYDSNRRQWTEFQVGNRPAIYMMICGSIMILLGSAYQICVKPIISKRVQKKAAARGMAIGSFEQR
jgi:hypothetical protein